MVLCSVVQPTGSYAIRSLRSPNGAEFGLVPNRTPLHHAEHMGVSHGHTPQTSVKQRLHPAERPLKQFRHALRPVVAAQAGIMLLNSSRPIVKHERNGFIVPAVCF